MDTEEYDVIIIGAGISGLTSAALLSKAGLKVCTLERHYLIGGYLQGFERKEYIFDTAIHWLNQCGEKGTVSRLFNYIGSDYPRPVVMENIQRHIGDKHDYVLSNKPEELRLRLIEDFPEDEKGINRFFAECTKDCGDFNEIFKAFPFNGDHELYGANTLQNASRFNRASNGETRFLQW